MQYKVPLKERNGEGGWIREGSENGEGGGQEIKEQGNTRMELFKEKKMTEIWDSKMSDGDEKDGKQEEKGGMREENKGVRVRKSETTMEIKNQSGIDPTPV